MPSPATSINSHPQDCSDKPATNLRPRHGDQRPKMSGLWPGSPDIRLDELDVICAVLGCGVDELLLPEPGRVPQPAPEGTEKPAATTARAVPRGRA
jgi:hypothetical protein